MLCSAPSQAACWREDLAAGRAGGGEEPKRPLQYRFSRPELISRFIRYNQQYFFFKKISFHGNRQPECWMRFEAVVPAWTATAWWRTFTGSSTGNNGTRGAAEGWLLLGEGDRALVRGGRAATVTAGASPTVDAAADSDW